MGWLVFGLFSVDDVEAMGYDKDWILIGLGFASISSEPEKSKWYLKLMSPVTWWSMIITSFYGKIVIAERNQFGELKVQSWAIPRFNVQYFSKWQRKAINGFIENAILEEESKGTKVLSLGLLNQSKELNQNGEFAFLLSNKAGGFRLYLRAKARVGSYELANLKRYRTATELKKDITGGVEVSTTKLKELQPKTLTSPVQEAVEYTAHAIADAKRKLLTAVDAKEKEERVSQMLDDATVVLKFVEGIYDKFLTSDIIFIDLPNLLVLHLLLLCNQFILSHHPVMVLHQLQDMLLPLHRMVQHHWQLSQVMGPAATIK